MKILEYFCSKRQANLMGTEQIIYKSNINLFIIDFVEKFL